MTVFHAPDFDNHEQVSFFSDPDSGLRAIIAIHWSGPGVAGGGVRMWNYADESKAVADALRLSRAMTYKFALADIPVGGGKTVVIGDAGRDKTPALLEALGRAVERFDGRYMCGPDVGTSPEDMVVIRRETEHVRGLPGESGDTSPATGYGVFQAIRAAVEHRMGRTDLTDLRVAVQGAGSVGRALMHHLKAAGARIIVADIDEAAVASAVQDFGALAVHIDDILFEDADVVAPCALGAVLNDTSIPQIRAAIVCGGANNQLAEDRHGIQLAERDILFVPDYVANAGGAINAVREGPDYDQEEAMAAVERIYETSRNVLRRAAADGIAPNLAADRIAAEIIGG